jgi:hypothetical protein
MNSFIESFEILSILKASRKKFHKKLFFSSGNIAIENLIRILKIQEILQKHSSSDKKTLKNGCM